jgi:hypothetical protein
VASAPVTAPVSQIETGILTQTLTTREATRCPGPGRPAAPRTPGRGLISPAQDGDRLHRRDIHHILGNDAGYNAVQTISGIGKVFTAVFLAEIGDVSRFDSP